MSIILKLVLALVSLVNTVLYSIGLVLIFKSIPVGLFIFLLIFVIPGFFLLSIPALIAFQDKIFPRTFLDG